MIEEKPSEQKAAQPKTELILQCLTAEHAALQSARGNAAADINARIYILLLAIIGGSIALAFVAQFSGAGIQTATQTASQNANAAQVFSQIPSVTPTATAVPVAALSPAPSAGAPFFWFGLMLFSALFFFGLTTFIYVLRATMKSAVDARGITQISNFYQSIAPETAAYFVHSAHDNRSEVSHEFGASHKFWQLFASPAGTAAFLNSILVAVWLSILLHSAFAPPAWLAAILGAFLFAASLAAHHFYQSRRWEDFEAHADTPKFPGETTR